MSAGADQAYFAEGLTEQIIHELAQDPGLRVVARTSAFAVSAVASDAREIGAHLGVGSLVEGSVRKDGERLRITAQLIRTDDGFHLWSQTYDREFADIFRTQTELAAEIRSQLRPKLAARVAPRKQRFANAIAYEEYLRGRAAWQRRPAGLEEASRHFERARELDPDLALAHAGLAETAFMRWHYEPDPNGEEGLLESAAASAQRAAALDPALAAPHVTLGLIAAARRKWESAEAEFRHALDLEPGDANAHHQLAGYLTRSGRFADAAHHFEVARSLDPLSPVLAADVAFLELYRRDYEAAIDAALAALALRPGDPGAVHVLASAYDALGRDAEAREATLLTVPPVWRPLRRVAARVLGPERAVRLELASQVRESGRPCTASPYVASLSLAFLGEDDRLYACLEEAIARHRTHDIAVAPAFDAYRTEPRFRELMRRAGSDEGYSQPDEGP
jgi:serine/threonine-protein kinase